VDVNSIWELIPTREARVNAADFAAKTLPWTFNRMTYNTTYKGQNSRAFNIVKGILAQEVLKEKLKNHNVKFKTDNSYRTSDIFDFLVMLDNKKVKLDLKTFNHYSDYNIRGRDDLTKDLIIKNSNYGGPDWRYFFPMLVPHNQIEQEKEAYCFGISTSIDFRNDVDKDRDGYYLCAFPYGAQLNFYSSKKLCNIREEKNKGIHVRLYYDNRTDLFNEKLELSIMGEWDGKYKTEVVKLNPNKSKIEIGPFSMISAIRISREQLEKFSGILYLETSKNELKEEVLNSQRIDINSAPKIPLTFTHVQFCNLIMPTGYKLYLLGWIYKHDFLTKCKKHKAWVWPMDSINKFENQAWSQITESDLSTIKKHGFDDSLSTNPRKFNAGWMKTNGRGGGACCYVFPNIGRNGGVMETNLYVLPNDLNELKLLINK
jgi:hypothetical protein